MRRARLFLLVTSLVAAGYAACDPYEEDVREPADDAGIEVVDAVAKPDVERPASDAGSDAESDAWIPCAMRALDPAHFCDDFDFQGAIPSKWTNTIAISGAIFDELNAHSPPRAFGARLIADAGPPTRAQLIRNRPTEIDLTTKSKLRLSFNLRVRGDPFATGTDNGRYLHIALLDFDDALCLTTPGSKTRSIEVSFVASNPANPLRIAVKGMRELCLPDAGGPQDIQTAPAVDIGYFRTAYRRVVLEVKRDATCKGGPSFPGSVFLQVDDLPGTCLPVADPFSHGQALKLLLGAYAGGAQPSGAFEASYDNVTFDIE